jgi:chemotaxis protein histidine kinase CheA
MDLTEFLSEFQLEAGEKLDIIASQLLQLERDASNPQPIREMFLAAHTIKGGAAMLRLTDIEGLAHAVEDLLGTLRDGAGTLNSSTADLLFQSIDQLRALVSAAGSDSVGAEPDPRVEQFAARLRGTPAAATLPERTAAPISTGLATPTAAATRRVLVVDDSATVRELHRMVLEDAGYEVVACEDGQAALRSALSETFAVVVAGTLLRGMGGFELCAALRDRNVAVVLASADADPDMARRASEAGARALVRKGVLGDTQLVEALTPQA